MVAARGAARGLAERPKGSRSRHAIRGEVGETRSGSALGTQYKGPADDHWRRLLNMQSGHRFEEPPKRLLREAVIMRRIEVEGAMLEALFVRDDNCDFSTDLRDPPPLIESRQCVDVMLEIVPSDDAVEHLIAERQLPAISSNIRNTDMAAYVANSTNLTSRYEVYTDSRLGRLAVSASYFEAKTTAGDRKYGESLGMRSGIRVIKANERRISSLRCSETAHISQ